MWLLFSAVGTASLLGSLHCVGMCGPLAIWASGGGEQRARSQIAFAASLYHVGRMVTYLLAGFIAGALGSLLDIGGQALGLQLAAARVVGVAMIAIGLLQLVRITQAGFPWLHSWLLTGGKMWSALTGSARGSAVPISTSRTRGAASPSLISGLLLKLRPYVFQLPLAGRGLATGLLTALLPCGWLYLFALVAAGTGSPLMGTIVLFAFWLGTVPALVGLVTGTQALAHKFRKFVPVGAALLLILGGGYTAAGRGFAKLNSLTDIHQSNRLSGKLAIDGNHRLVPLTAENLSQEMEQWIATPLPCCPNGPSLNSIEDN